MRRIPAIALFLLFLLLALIVIALAPEAAAWDEYLDNENSGDARWIEPPETVGPIRVWHRQTGTNTDWWRFNASAGDHMEIRFRKYTENPNLGLPSWTYYINWDLWGPYVPGINVYTYDIDGPRWGDQPREYHRRDTFSMYVQENKAGIYYLRVRIDPPNQNPYRDGFYWLNVTTTPTPALDRTRTGVMAQNGDYDLNYNFEDYFTMELDASTTSGDRVTVTLDKAEADAAIYVEAWEKMSWGSGGGQGDHMLNRSYYTNTLQLTIEFTASHPDIYFIRVYRNFNDLGATSYTLNWALITGPLEADDLHTGATDVPKASTLTGRSVEMGHDTHDWYKVQLKAGDKKFGVKVTITDPNLADGHGFEVVVYSEGGQYLYDSFNRQWNGEEYVYNSLMEVPPAGTPTIFDEDTWYYVRVSVDPVITSAAVTGFKGAYEIEFVLSNRAPELVVPFEERYEWDEDTPLSIELDSHFIDIDGDLMDYTIFNKTAGWTVDSNGLNYWGYLNITPAKDFNGEVWWKLRAYDEGFSSEETHWTDIWLKLRVLPVSDRPTSKGSITAACDEEGNTSVDLNTLFSDVDSGPEGVLTFGWNESVQLDLGVTLDPSTGIMDLVPDPDAFGQFNIGVWCYDDNPERVYGVVVLNVKGINDVPRIVSAIPVVELEEGDDPVERDLSPYFVEVDDEALTYTWAVPGSLSDKINVYHKNNVQTESRVIIELLDDHFYGRVVLNITATDTKNTLVKQDLVINIVNLPDPPVIMYTPEGNPSPIDEKGSITFKVTDVLDPDIPETGLHTYTWYLDGVVIADFNESIYYYIANYDSAGAHTVKVVVTDPTGLKAQTDPEWTFTVSDINRRPTATITTPSIALKEGQKLTLTVEVDDPDGDELTITWYRIAKQRDIPLGAGETIEAKDLPAGTITIEVVVDDGKGGTVTDNYIIKVAADEDEGGLGTMLWVILIIVAVVILVALLVMLRRSKATALPPEATIDIDSLDREYDPSQGRGVGGDGWQDEYDPSPKSGEGYDRLQ